MAMLGAGALVAAAAPARAQFDGSVAYQGCTGLVMDNRAEGGELYIIKTHNSGSGPDEHMDWLFDVTARGGQRLPFVDVGGAAWSTADTFRRHTTPPEEAFVFITYPDSWLGFDSSDTRGGTIPMGVVQRQRIGDSLPVGVSNGIGLVLPGTAQGYSVGAMSTRDGSQALFPIGSSHGIEVAFAPVAEINPLDVDGSGCTVGGEVIDEHAGGGIINGYNIYRVLGVPSVVPSADDFVGNWQYYCPFDSFDLDVPDSPGSAGVDLNGDGIPDGDGTDAPNDSLPNDLCGFSNPDGIAYTGDEVILYQDSATNPDGTARISGTPPVQVPGRGYWYAFQPVVFQGTTVLTDYDGPGFSESDIYPGLHALDTDADTIPESLDLDLDRVREFYSPQVVIGQTGLGLTFGGLPFLSPPVWGQVNPALAVGEPRITGTVVGDRVQLTFSTGFEAAAVMGYDVYRHDGDYALGVPVNRSLIAARGGDGNVYTLVDVLAGMGRPVRMGHLEYSIEVVMDDGQRLLHGPYQVELPNRLPVRRHR